jgi:hypothetical protein
MGHWRTTLMGLLLLTATARAAEPPAEARAYFEKGQVCFKLQNWSCAIEEWKHSYEYWRSAVTLFNIAQAQRLGGDLEAALMSYKFYLSDSPNGDYVAVATGMIQKLQPLVDQARASKSAPPVGAAKEPEKTKPPEVTPPPPAAVVPAAIVTPPPTTTVERRPARTGLYAGVGVVVGAVIVGAAVGIGVGVGTAPGPSVPVPTSGGYTAVNF